MESSDTPAWLAVLGLVLDFLKNLAWPLALMFVAFFFRSDIKRILPNIKKVGPAGLELKEIRQSPDKSVRTPDGLRDAVDLTQSALIKEIEASLYSDLDAFKEEKRIDVLIRHLAHSRLQTVFERIYAQIFGSQIDALRRLKAVGGMVSLEEARQFFHDEAKGKHPEFYADAEFEVWFRYLAESRLAKIEGQSVLLDALADDFLLFLTTKSNDQKPF